jgi:hypothetical protein
MRRQCVKWMIYKEKIMIINSSERYSATIKKKPVVSSTGADIDAACV